METQENKPVETNQKRWQEVLATPPPKNIVLEHPIYSKVKYIPIGTIEGMLDRIFGVGNWKVEILDTKMMANSVVVAIRLHYRVDGEWLFHDGVGAAPLQVNQGAKPTDVDELKSNSVMIGLPAAKSFAIKDAAEHLGELFGRNLNREHYIHSMKTENRIEKEIVKVEINQNQNK